MTRHESMNSFAAQVNGARRVLIAEDDPVSQAIFEDVLHAMPDVATDIVGDGREALALCISEEFDLFIFDLNLPSVKGSKLLSYIRTSSRLNREKPVLLMSALPEGELMKVKGAALASAILHKPFNITELTRIVSDLLEA